MWNPLIIKKVESDGYKLYYKEKSQFEEICSASKRIPVHDIRRDYPTSITDGATAQILLGK